MVCVEPEFALADVEVVNRCAGDVGVVLGFAFVVSPYIILVGWIEWTKPDMDYWILEIASSSSSSPTSNV